MDGRRSSVSSIDGNSFLNFKKLVPGPLPGHSRGLILAQGPVYMAIGVEILFRFTVDRDLSLKISLKKRQLVYLEALSIV